MKQNKGLKYAYLAGIVDGEGCITIRRSKRKSGSGTGHTLMLYVVQKDGRMIDYLFGAFGGIPYAEKRNGDKGPYYRWVVTGAKAAYLLKRILPFLRYKKDQAEVAIRFQTAVDNQHKKRLHAPGQKFKRLEPHETSIRDECWQKLKDLKQEVHPSAAVTTKRSGSSEDDNGDTVVPDEIL